MAPADTPEPPLACSVRDCAEPLHRVEASYRCRRGHTFDVARSGYVNLLQPQDRRSRHAGDTAAAVAARGRLLAAGVGAAAVTQAAHVIGALDLGPHATVVDLGCGGGELLGAIAAIVTSHKPSAFATVASPGDATPQHPADRQRHGDTDPSSLIGIDLSPAAVEAAARRFPALTWVVANADRRLPLLDASVDVILSLNGRRNPTEAARVLRAPGTLIIGVPAGDDLIELRGQVLGGRVERDRVAGVLDEHAALFTVRDRLTVRERQSLDRAALLDLLAGTYRGQRTSHAGRLATLDRLDVTSAIALLVLART